MKTFAIGDIHGCYLGLLQCLERSGFDKDKDRLISLGDIADGWSQVVECVEELMEVKNLIAIRGNHDFWLLQWLEYGIAQRGWRQQGGQSTIDSYIKHGKSIDPAHLKFFKDQVYYFNSPTSQGFVHGGYRNANGLGHDDNNTYIWDREMWNYAECYHNTPEGRSIFFNNNYDAIFIGHSNTQSNHPDLKPVNRLNVWNLDQGAGWSGKLTVMDVDTKEYWQSDLVTELYPNEKGR